VTAKEKTACGHCGAALEWLGKLALRRDGDAPATVAYWICPACERQWVQHSERGWRETRVDLTAE
jgi:hypothetical protein